MNKIFTLLTAAFLSVATLSLQAQSGSPNFGGATGKLFGDNQTFSAKMEIETSDTGSGKDVTMPGKLSYDNGKSRFEMNLGEVKGGGMPANALEQLKAMGMDILIAISRPEKKATYIIYPSMQSYVENPEQSKADSVNADDLKMEATELGKETVDGHACVKNKVTVTDKDGKKHESTVWNATDLKKFPVKIQSEERGQKFVMHFRDVSLTKPDASTFEIPAGCTKYASMQSLMQEVITKKMGGGMGGGAPRTPAR